MASQVHLILLYHPATDPRLSPLPNAIVKRLESLYPGGDGTIQVAHIRYGTLSSSSSRAGADGGVDMQCLLSSSSKLALSPFASSSVYWQQQQDSSGENDSTSDLLRIVSDIKQPRAENGEDVLESFLHPNGKPSIPRGCLTDGLVAAVELFSRATPSVTPPLARYLLHLLPDTPSLDMNDNSFPHSNLDSGHDRWSWIRAAQELGKMGVWPSTHVIPPSPTAAPSSLTPEGEKVHKCILEELPAMYPSISDAPGILGGQYKGTNNGHGLLLSGFSDACATAARASAGVNLALSRKRGRKVSMGAKSQKDKAREEERKKATTDSSAQGLPAADSRNKGPSRVEVDKGAVSKILFLQQQQQMMMRNLAIIARNQQAAGPDQDSHTKHRLLEQFRDQLVAQQAALRAQAAIVQAGGAAPTLNNALTVLVAIDKDASEKGLHLGGPSGNQQAAIMRQRQMQQQQSMPNPTTDASNAASNPGATLAAVPPLLGGQASAQQKKPGGVQAFWNGAILWSIALSNNKRNHAVTFVSAQNAPNTSKDTLMLPWPQRLNISEVQAISMPALQSYAAKNSTSCILFQPLAVPMPPRPQGSNGAAPAPQQSNETMYAMLTKMIDSKKSCAFISLQGDHRPAEAGIVVVASPTQAGGSSRKLIGLIFNQAVPWHLLGGEGVGQQQQQQPQQQQPQASSQQHAPPTNVGHFSANAAQSQMPPSLSTHSITQGLFQPQQQAPQLNNAFSATPSTNQQMPMWARPVAPTSFAPSMFSNSEAPSSATFSAPPPALSISALPADMLANNNFNLGALANQMNFTNQQQQQAPPPPAFNANMFNSNIWNTPANNNDPSQSLPNGQASQQPPPSVDLEALQRLLGLNT